MWHSCSNPLFLSLSHFLPLNSLVLLSSLSIVYPLFPLPPSSSIYLSFFFPLPTLSLFLLPSIYSLSLSSSLYLLYLSFFFPLPTFISLSSSLYLLYLSFFPLPTLSLFLPSVLCTPPLLHAAGSLPVSRVESVPGFQMHSEDFPALPGTSKANGK